MMKKILVVDDDKELLDLIESILKAENYEVTLLDNADDVINIIHRTAPDLILLDVMLGRIDGRDVCRHIKSHRKINTIPVIMLTATSDVRPMFEDFLPDDFISKPFEVEKLLHAVNVQLGRHPRKEID